MFWFYTFQEEKLNVMRHLPTLTHALQKQNSFSSVWAKCTVLLILVLIVGRKYATIVTLACDFRAICLPPLKYDLVLVVYDCPEEFICLPCTETFLKLIHFFLKYLVSEIFVTLGGAYMKIHELLWYPTPIRLCVVGVAGTSRR